MTFFASVERPWRTVWVSDHVETVLGVPPAEMLGEDAWLDRVAPADRETVLDGCRRYTAGEPVTMEYRLRHRDGHDVWVREVGAVEADESGIRHVQGYLVDLTERRQAEDDLREAMEQVQLLLGQLPAVLWTTDAELRLDSVAGHDLVAFGIEAANVVGRSLHELPRPRPELVAAHERALRGEPGEYELMLQERTLRARVEPLRDREGRVVGTIGVGFDVTERELATAAVRASEELFRAVFDNAGDAMLIADDEGCWADANPAACELMGRPREELLTLGVGDLWRDASEPREAPRRRAVRGDATGTQTIVRPDGAVRHVEVMAHANVLPGRHLTLLRDLTERRRLEQELWLTQRLDSVGRLAGGIAHDFNNMLTAIAGHTQLLTLSLEPGTDERRHADEIAHAAARAAALTAQLLAFASRQMLQPREVDLNELVSGLASMLTGLAADVELELDLAPQPVTAVADPAQIEQVIVNLVVNAVDACVQGGRIVVGTRGIADSGDLPTELAPGPYAVLEVADTGSGMDEDVRLRVFEPFFTTKAVGRGSGLGLATAFGIARQSGGTVTVESRTDDGATFRLWLPWAGRPSAAAPNE
ncbi:MAG TPA: PAS domain S-box protein [Gaiellaceae bacterium]|nr:PAS domain S-box protein [Gaiellaceae bacterium]